MNQRDVFEMHEVVDRVYQVLTSKNAEYAREHILSNFERSGAALGVTPIAALAGFVTKHFISFLDFAQDTNRGKTHPLDQWEEKIFDIIAYMILARMIVKQDQNKRLHEPNR